MSYIEESTFWGEGEAPQDWALPHPLCSQTSISSSSSEYKASVVLALYWSLMHAMPPTIHSLNHHPSNHAALHAHHHLSLAYPPHSASLEMAHPPGGLVMCFL